MECSRRYKRLEALGDYSGLLSGSFLDRHVDWETTFEILREMKASMMKAVCSIQMWRRGLLRFFSGRKRKS